MSEQGGVSVLVPCHFRGLPLGFAGAGAVSTASALGVPREALRGAGALNSCVASCGMIE